MLGNTQKEEYDYSSNSLKENTGIEISEAMSSKEFCEKLLASNAYLLQIANALSILIPCHRVIALNGSLGGYAG